MLLLSGVVVVWCEKMKNKNLNWNKNLMLKIEKKRKKEKKRRTVRVVPVEVSLLELLESFRRLSAHGGCQVPKSGCVVEVQVLRGVVRCVTKLALHCVVTILAFCLRTLALYLRTLALCCGDCVMKHGVFWGGYFFVVVVLSNYTMVLPLKRI